MDEQLLNGKNVLIADDDEFNIYALTAALEDFGLNITTVGNGVEVVKAITAPDSAFDLLLIDIMMPEMDGFEAMRALRGIGYTHLPIIALTAKAMKSDIEKCYEAGASDYMAKPINVAKLLQMMIKWVGK